MYARRVLGFEPLQSVSYCFPKNAGWLSRMIVAEMCRVGNCDGEGILW